MGRLNALRTHITWPVTLACALFMGFIAWNGLPNKVIAWDVLGYYLILPLTLIYNDPGLANAEPFMALINDYSLTDSFYQMIQTAPNRWVMKYPLGMAVLYGPFFALGHLFAWLSGDPTNGLSASYNLALVFGSVVYSCLGIFLSYKVLVRHFSRQAAAMGLFLILFGTNWLITHGISMMMPHIPLFTLTAAVLLVAPRWLALPSVKNSVLLGGCLGLTALARPTEAWLAVLPFFWGMDGWPALRKRLRWLFIDHRSTTLLVAAVGMAIVAPQFLYWKWATGNFLYTEYGNAGEGLDLNRPHLINFLFSFRKGWFVYTPLMAIAMLGYIAVWKNHRLLFWPCLLFTAGAIYLAASWSTWWYAASFSQRAMVQTLPVLAIPLTALVQLTLTQTRTLRTVVFGTIFLTAAFNLFQSWQFAVGILPPDRITAAYYQAAFLATSTPARAEDLLLIDRSRSYSPSHLPDTSAYMALKPLTIANPMPTVSQEGDSLLVAQLPNVEYYDQLFMHFDRITDADHAFLVLDGWIRVRDTAALSRNHIVATANFRKKPYGYHARLLDELVVDSVAPNQWMPFRFTYLTPEFRRRDDAVSMYFWRHDTSELLLAHLSITPYVKRTSLTTASP